MNFGNKKISVFFDEDKVLMLLKGEECNLLDIDTDKKMENYFELKVDHEIKKKRDKYKHIEDGYDTEEESMDGFIKSEENVTNIKNITYKTVDSEEENDK